MDINRDIKKAAQQLRLGKGDHRSLKKAQIQAIQAAVSGDDVFLVAPTGFGKSAVLLCCGEGLPWCWFLYSLCYETRFGDYRILGSVRDTFVQRPDR